MAEKKRLELKRVRELIDLMIKNDLVEIEVVDGDSKVLLKRPQPGHAPVVMQSAPAPAGGVIVGGGVEQIQQPAEEESDDLVEITAPIVGTFYASPSPDSKPFVKSGSHVDEDTVVCIIEAMKVMNEIKAQMDGTIVEVVCKAGQAVEFGQPLFKVRPD
ncbi:MAG: acetyl-CoA carboxylase biotin carboxyl carrier protein [Planctomycetota bacterium]|nr:MAG: acetyl-CoA carboxylase biotin carboxyl carrier protein [Planctomycetota bacterium]